MEKVCHCKKCLKRYKKNLVKIVSNTNNTDGFTSTLSYSLLSSTNPISTSINLGPVVCLYTNTSVMITLTSAIYVIGPTPVTDIAAMSYIIYNSDNVLYPLDINNGHGPDDFLSLSLGSPTLTVTGDVNSLKCSASYIIKGLNPGLNTFMALYRSQSTNSQVVAGFNTRNIIITLID